MQTEDGFEQTLQVNFWAHALLTLGLLPRVKAAKDQNLPRAGSAKGRVIMMASGFEWFFGQLEWDNLRCA